MSKCRSTGLDTTAPHRAMFKLSDIFFVMSLCQLFAVLTSVILKSLIMRSRTYIGLVGISHLKEHVNLSIFAISDFRFLYQTGSSWSKFEPGLSCLMRTMLEYQKSAKFERCSMGLATKGSKTPTSRKKLKTQGNKNSIFWHFQNPALWKRCPEKAWLIQFILIIYKILWFKW